MSYETGTCNSLSAIATFIQNSCTSHGWTLSGDVLWKGSTFVEIKVDGVVGISIKGGTGKDGSNLLTGGGPAYCYLGTVAGQALAYPLTAHAFVNDSPDEVVIVLNFSTQYHEVLAFGISDVPGLTGTGVWYHATRFATTGSFEYCTGEAGVQTFTNFGGHADGAPMFSVYAGYSASGSGGYTNSFLDCDIDGQGWYGTAGGDFPSSNLYLSPLLAAQPNGWNEEAILLPFQIYVPRTSGSKYSLVGDLKHIRHVRIDYLEPGDVITLGADQWKIFPWFRKDTTARNGGNQLTHSGTYGFAVRYTP